MCSLPILRSDSFRLGSLQLVENSGESIKPSSMDTNFNWSRFHYKTFANRQCQALSSEVDPLRAYWLDFWCRVFAKNGVSFRPSAFDFDSSDLVSVITLDGDLAAILLHRVKDLDPSAIEKDPYFAGEAGALFLERLRSMNLHKVLTAEYLTVHPQFLRRKTGIDLMELFIRLMIYHIEKLGLDGSVAKCRKDIRVADAYFAQGARPLVADVLMHNTPTDFCALTRAWEKPISDPQLSCFVEDLWNRSFSNPNSNQSQNAA